LKKLEKLKEIYNNLKNYYKNNKQDILTISGFFCLVFTITLLVTELSPITNCSGIPLERTLELFTVTFIGVTALSVFFISFMILIKLIKDKIQQNKEENKFIRTVSWFNIIFITSVFLIFALFPLYQLYSGNILICGVVPEITMQIYLFVLSIYIIFSIILLMFVTFIENLLISVYNIIKRKVDKDN
jgi:amino acid transporter